MWEEACAPPRSFSNYGGDHILLLGAVEHYAYSDRAPLIFRQGRYM